MLSVWQWLLIGVVSFFLPMFLYIPMMFFGMKSMGVERRTKGSFGFFHPFTNDGGGGERVLWCAVKAVQEECPQSDVIIYTVDMATPESLAARAADKFGVKLPQPLSVARLFRRSWIEAKSYPRLTILGQSLGSIVLAWEALNLFMPEVFIDTSGYAFTYPLARLFGCRVVSYTHYPTISLDMLTRVKSRRALYNNDQAIAQSGLLSGVKVQYYRLMAFLYGLAGARADVVMVNSSWTEAHINGIWKVPQRTFRVFPPCDTESLQALPLERPEKGRYLLSVAQFRPEKDHRLQLKAFAAALNKASGREAGARGNDFSVDWRLKLVGSSRHKEDEKRIDDLRALARELGIANRVDFHVNSPYSELQKLLGGASAGLHTMLDEHFGIVVVEYMAAGAVPIAHRSGGPQADIVVPVPQVGLLAETVDEFAEAIHTVLKWPEAKRKSVAQAAREKAKEFSGERFTTDFKRAVYPVLPNDKKAK
ncbi:UDP-Glycosyltransferase superfamilly protein [Klebsormidium nitens]|uniref:GDP-Man:Man(3)GlcNAc(2)-PP-Dol alpha-1,2-mannosyltransferase n=1 Tax=Klebsormidium nitens TaxID=105231 RepID=A0A1Y1HWM8_KLENI|nr:UDP-Glycosyltransferase superfamilly protein [Klebsormidium nitens]|eukprot:GAQ82192.1 UDP-Glycosyltransferase superfamilly protein [Klebsormidium nitens]